MKTKLFIILAGTVLLAGCASRTAYEGVALKPRTAGITVDETQRRSLNGSPPKNGSRAPASVEVERRYVERRPDGFAPAPVPIDHHEEPAVMAPGAPAPAAAEPPRPPAPETRELSTGKVLVYYATNRNRTSSADPAKVFGHDPNTEGDGMTYGTVLVSIPVEVHKPGVVEGTSVLRLDLREDPARHVVMNMPRDRAKSEFYEQMSRDVARRENKELLIFIHGFNNSFETAAKRLAVLKYDIGFRGVPVLFSWPAKTGAFLPLVYIHDSSQANEAVASCTRFFQELVETAEGFGAKRVHVVAHSMGNRLLVEGLKSLPTRPDGKRWFGEVVMAAPDVQQQRFDQDKWPGMHGKFERSSLYACKADAALWASFWAHDYRRIGQGGDGRLLLPGLETIDVSNLGIFSDSINHWHFGHVKVRTDLRRVVIERLKPERRGLTPSQAMDPRFWFFGASEAN